MEDITLWNFQGNGERILLVEDEPEVRAFVTSLLTESNYSVFEAANAMEAIEIFDMEGGNFDLAFIDVVLPDKDGIELVEYFQSRNADIPMLLCSGYPDHRSQWSKIQKMGLKFISKPYEIDELLKIIKELIGND
ncbi:response regulator [candidate division WOR-3 bacterium]|nr:response regulator [candidate division WOR-3 bacterium]